MTENHIPPQPTAQEQTLSVVVETADDMYEQEENTRVRYARVAPTPLASTVYGAIADAEKRDNRFTLRYNKVNIGSKVLDIQFTEGLFIKKQSDSLPVGKPWPDDFPKAIIHTTQEKIYKDFGEEFKAAKAGDMEAARTIVRALIKPERIAALVSSYPDTIVAFPNKRKEDGNKMPTAYAEVLGQAGLRVDNSIRQIASPHHTGTVDLLRLFMRARFDGEVEQNANYLVIDDRLSSGGTARDLKDYIESKGGHVVAVSALTCSRNGTLMSQNDEIRRALQDLHITDKQLRDYGIATSVDCLTYGEASRLARLSKFGVERVSKKDLEARPEYKVIIAGGRHFDNYELLKEKCDYFLQDKVKTHRIVVVSGKASGADKLGERYAEEKGYEIEEHPANWEQNGRAAGPIRNAEMAKASNALIAFWDGKSRGTQSMINLAKKHNLEVATVKVVKLQEEYHWSDKTEVKAKQVLNKAIYMHDKMNEAITVYDIPEDKWKSKYPNPIDRLYKAISRYGEIEVAYNTKEYRTAIEKMKLNGNTDNIKALHKTVGSTSIYFILPTDYNANELQTAQKAKSVQTEQETEITETAEQHLGWHR